MIVRITNMRLPMTGETDQLHKPVAQKLALSVGQINQVTIVRRGIDARRKHTISFVYTLDVDVSDPHHRIRLDRDVKPHEPGPALTWAYGTQSLTARPVVVGMGPAGMWAALVLARHGYAPLVLERGQQVQQRVRDVQNFWKTGMFNSQSNVQFGEGGAGAFSDGKLTTRINDVHITQVVQDLIAFGAPPDIAYVHKPHVGTDKLRAVVTNLRRMVIALGGEVRFGAQVTDLVIQDHTVVGVELNHREVIPCGALLMAIGHSARDTYEMLHRRGIAMQAKAFAVGVRIEHPQQMVDVSQYGDFAGHPKLGSADYSLVYQHRPSGRAVYSFCMCPGGRVVAAASEERQVVTNGMSDYARDSGVANSAVVVSVTPADYGGDHPLAGVEFQRHWENQAFVAGHSTYGAPVQLVGDFLNQMPSTHMGSLVTPSYQPGVVPGDVGLCLPPQLAFALRDGIVDFGRKIKGFDHPQALLTAIETRTSAPVRILRETDGQAVHTQGLYPIGEGAGYAGGIMSAAVDGMKAAGKVMGLYQRPRQ